MTSEVVADPGEPLVETRQERGQGDPSDRRVTTAGDVLERTSTNVYFDGQDWHFDPQPLEWRRVVRLDASELEAVREAIASSGFMDVAPEHRPHGTSIGGTNVTWTVNDGGRTHTVRLFGVPDVEVPEVTALSKALEGTIARAIQRAAGV
jgi:hypothetical protein